jgi:ankyrin repeat protein
MSDLMGRSELSSHTDGRRARRAVISRRGTAMHTYFIAIVATVGILGGSIAAAAATLIDAVKAGNRTAVQQLLHDKVDVNQVAADGSTPLHWAVRADDVAMTEMLLAAGAKASAITRTGVTPLGLAAANGNVAMVEALLKAGADPKTTSSEGETVLMTAARSGSAPVVKALLARGADANAKEGWLGQTALMWAAAANAGDVVAALAEAGADLNAKSTATQGQPRMPRVQGVAAQASHSNFPKGGFTPLLFAAREGASAAAEVLAERGADLNLADPDGIAPLSMAIINGHYDLAAYLIDKGANVNAADRAGRTALFFATDMHTLEWLFSRPVPRPSGELDSPDIVAKLLDKGADVNARLTGRPFILHHNATGNRTISEGATPLMKTATTSDLSLMRVLLERGADPTIKTRNNTTTVMAAAGLNWVDISSIGTEAASIEALTLLLDRGVDINAVNDEGDTAAHGAAQRGADKVLQFLFDRGAKIDVKNKDGRTPFDEALGQSQVAEDNARRPVRTSTQALIRRLLAQ